MHDSNSLLLGGTLASFGCDVEHGGRVPDTLAETERLFAAALEADLVVSSGGVSVGPRDHVKPALTALGVEELFWRVAIQPGKPVWAGRAPSGAIVLGLPGQPAVGAGRTAPADPAAGRRAARAAGRRRR